MPDSSRPETPPAVHHASTAIDRSGVLGSELGSQDRMGGSVSHVVLALVALLSACAGSVPLKKSPPEGGYLRAVKERVAAVQGNVSLSLRHNPAPCDCPPHEVLVADVWHRVALDVGTSDEEALADAAGFFEAHPTQRLTVTGTIGPELRSCARGAIFLTLTLDKTPSDEAAD